MRHLKQEFDKLSFKDVLCYILAFSSMIAAFVMVFLGMLMPPEGEIHSSVLYAFALVLFFVAALLGIDRKYASAKERFEGDIINLVKNLNHESKPTSTETDSAV